MRHKIVQKVCLHSIGVVVPGKHNKYRPYGLRHPVLAILSIFIIFSKITAVALLAVTPETAYLSTITAPFLIDQTNASRREAGLPALSPNSLLSQSARLKGEDMLKNGYFAHTSPSGITPWKWFDQAGYNYVYAGENLAIDFSIGEDVHNAWMASAGHRQNILSTRYRDIGIAVVSGEFNGRTTTIVVQHFGSLTTNISTTPIKVPVTSSATPTPLATPNTPNPIEKIIKPQPTKTPVSTTPAPIISTPIPAPEILIPTEGQILPSGASTVRGKSAEGSAVELNMDGKKVGTYQTVDGIFAGYFEPPQNTEKKAKLTAFARVGNRVSNMSPERNVVISTKGPTISPDSAIFLPDPNGDASSLMLVVPIFGSPKTASAIIDGEVVPLTLTGSVATGRISTGSSVSRFTVRAEDGNGNVRTSTVFPLQQYHLNQQTEEEKKVQEKINNISSKVRDIGILLVYLLALLLAINVLIHIKIQHIDLIIHALLVIGMGILLFLIT